MNNSFIIVIISWLLPGAGYFIQKRWEKGLLVSGVVWVMFIIAILSGGAYYPGFDFKDGALLYLLNLFAKFGNGLGAFISFYLLANSPVNAAAWATFEYGGRFLEVAGLINYLAVLDIMDLQIGRKK